MGLAGHVDGISRSRGWDKEIPQGVLPMEQLVLSDKWARNFFLTYQSIQDRVIPMLAGCRKYLPHIATHV